MGFRQRGYLFLCVRVQSCKVDMTGLEGLQLLNDFIRREDSKTSIEAQ